MNIVVFAIKTITVTVTVICILIYKHIYQIEYRNIYIFLYVFNFYLTVPKPALKYIGVNISQQMDTNINQAVEGGRYATRSELVRTAIRKLLTEEA